MTNEATVRLLKWAVVGGGWGNTAAHAVDSAAEVGRPQSAGGTAASAFRPFLLNERWRGIARLVARLAGPVLRFL